MDLKNSVLARKLQISYQMENKHDDQKEEVMEVMDMGGIPEGLPEEFQVGKDMRFGLNSMRAAERENDDPMWSPSSALPSDWLFGDE